MADILPRRADQPCPVCDCPPHEWCAQECGRVREVPVPAREVHMKPRIMTDEERDEIAQIELRKKAEFEEAGRKLFGCGFSAKHPRMS
jgi:hypothetical protein